MNWNLNTMGNENSLGLNDVIMPFYSTSTFAEENYTPEYTGTLDNSEFTVPFAAANVNGLTITEQSNRLTRPLPPPGDPGQALPVGDVMIPLLLCVAGYGICKWGNVLRNLIKK